MTSNKFFPFYDITGTNTKTWEFNINPRLPESLDPRDIISEWSEESKATLNQDDIYAGMKIYSLDDRTLRICRWTPAVTSSTKFTANDCVWDILHGDEDEWIDVETYNPEKPINEQIADGEKIKWQYQLVSTDSYAGFKISDDVNEINNFIINNVTNDKHIAFTYTFAETNASKADKVFNVDFSKYDLTCAEEVADKKFLVMCPSESRTAKLEKRKISSIKLNGVELDKTINTEELFSKQKNANVLYDVYELNNAFTSDEIEGFINGTNTLVITFTKIS